MVVVTGALGSGEGAILNHQALYRSGYLNSCILGSDRALIGDEGNAVNDTTISITKYNARVIIGPIRGVNSGILYREPLSGAGEQSFGCAVLLFDGTTR